MNEGGRLREQRPLERAAASSGQPIHHARERAGFLCAEELSLSELAPDALPGTRADRPLPSRGRREMIPRARSDTVDDHRSGGMNQVPPGQWGCGQFGDRFTEKAV